MNRTRVTEWPKVRLTVNPATLEALEVEAEARALPVSAVIRETLDRAYRPGEPKSSPSELLKLDTELA
jgi:hypothetical protein